MINNFFEEYPWEVWSENHLHRFLDILEKKLPKLLKRRNAPKSVPTPEPAIITRSSSKKNQI